MSPTGTAQLALALAEHADLHDEHGMEGDDRGMYDERERDESNEPARRSVRDHDER